jgi:hypothetical protein
MDVFFAGVAVGWALAALAIWLILRGPNIHLPW